MTLQKYSWVDALRGYAILLVMMIHTGQMFAPDKHFYGKITRLGDMGVTLFFIASSFTLFNSFSKRRLTEVKKAKVFFFVRRFFRIAPAYYLALIVYSLICLKYQNLFIQEPLNLIKVVANMLFVNGLYMQAVNYLPPGSWSIGVEMLFYLFIPILFKFVNNLKKSAFLLVSTVVLSQLLQIAIYFAIGNPERWIGLRGSQLYFWLPNQFPVFTFGIFLYFLLKTKLHPALANSLVIIAIVLFFALSGVAWNLNFPNFLFQREYICSIIFTLFAAGLSSTSFDFLIKPLQHLGQVSFSAYLWHFIVIQIVSFGLNYLFPDNLNNNIKFLITFSVVIPATFFVAKTSYIFIEKNGIALGDYVVSKIETHKKRSEILL